MTINRQAILSAQQQIMDRKKIIEKQKAFGSICQSKTGDAILRKNVFETRVLKTRLSELETEERRWRTSFSFEVKEAKKEAHTVEVAKRLSFRQVAKAAFAANKFKNLLPVIPKRSHVNGMEGAGKEAEIIDEKSIQSDGESRNEETEKQPDQERPKTTSIPKISIDLPARAIKTPLGYARSFPEKSPNFPSPLSARQRGETFSGRSLRHTDLPKTINNGDFTHGINGNKRLLYPCILSPSSEKSSFTLSPMLDRRFLELEAILVPMHPNEESGSSENEEDVSDGASSRSGSSLSYTESNMCK